MFGYISRIVTDDPDSIASIFVTLLAIVILLLLFAAAYLLEYRGKTDKTELIRRLVESRGFRFETHRIVTDDGYILTAHRVRAEPGPEIGTGPSQKKPVLIAHGLYCSSIDFFYTALGSDGKPAPQNNADQSDSIVFTLLAEGWRDVWLMNNRGNAFSLAHKHYEKRDPEFWRFSCDELARHDLRATIDYVCGETRRPQLAFIGFSQGNLLAFALMSESPKYAQILRPFVAWAPAAYFHEMRSPIRWGTRGIALFRWLENEFFLFRLTNWLGRRFRPTILVQWITATIFRGVMGATDRSRHTDLPIWLHHFPSSGSMWQLVHHLQWTQTGRFTKFDFGCERRNALAYDGARRPPRYRLERIPDNTVIVLIRGSTDTMTTSEDTDRLMRTLDPNNNRDRRKHLFDVKIGAPIWNHLDFIMNRDANRLVYRETCRFLEQFECDDE